MSHFKDRLWSELVRAHGADLTQITHPPRSRRRPRMLAGTGLGLLAAGTAAAVVVGTAGTVPAFAVTKNHDGSVTVSINRLAGIPAANARLAALGYRARVVQVSVGCGAAAPRAARLRGAPAPAALRQALAQARFDPRQVPPGRVLVIPASSSGQSLSPRAVRMIHGQVPACLPPPISGRGAFRGPCPKMHIQGSARHRQRPLAVHRPTRLAGGHGAPTQVTVSCPAPHPGPDPRARARLH
jgi:hypothetical protein